LLEVLPGDFAWGFCPVFFAWDFREGFVWFFCELDSKVEK